MQTFIEQVVIDNSVRSLCIRPYLNHPKGCPNYGKRISCPPECELLEDVYDLSKGFYVVWIDFNFESHCRKMRRKHPQWSPRQVECCLYWQGKARKELKEELIDVMFYLEGTGNWKVATCPEAMGVNLTETMKKLNVQLEWPPIKIVRKIALVGILK